MENSVNKAYAAWPTRLYVVETEGRIAVASHRGPAGLASSIKEAERWLNAFTAQLKDIKVTPATSAAQ